jgi:hypothetical protein
VAELIGQVAQHGGATERLRTRHPVFEVPHDGFTRHQELVDERYPRTTRQTFLSHVLGDLGRALGSHR